MKCCVIFTSFIMLSSLTENTDAVDEESAGEKLRADTSPKINSSLVGSLPENQDAVVERCDNITKAKHDDLSYRGLRLNNGMHVLLISDPETDKAAASMAVVVGIMHDPAELPGLSVLLDRVIFRGSERFPAEDYFQKYVEAHAGSWNGGTAEGWQEYHWDVSSRHLAEMLDTWVEYFLKPTMSPSVIQREVKIMESSKTDDMIDDSERFDQLKKWLSKPGHGHRRVLNAPFKQLKERGEDLREKLMDFYSRWYSSNILYVAVLGKESLNELEEMVVPLLSKIPNKDRPKLEYGEHPWGPEQMMKKVYFVPIADIRQLTVRFSLPWVEGDYETAPLSYISMLLGHEGPGSLYAELVERDWSEGLYVGPENIPGFSFYYVLIELTEEAMAHIDEIIKLIFQYIHLLRKEGAKQWLFEENKALNELGFHFQSKIDPINYVQYLSSTLIDYRFEDVLSYDIPKKWNKIIIDGFLEYLEPSNMNVLIASQLYEEIADQIEETFETQFKMENMSEDLIEEFWNIREPFHKFHLPAPNEFMVRNFDLYPLDEKAQSRTPHIIHKSSISQFWFQQDMEFKLPKLFIKFKIFSPITCLNRQYQLLSGIFVDLFIEVFSKSYGYAASLAQFEWRLRTFTCGLQISVSGFTEKLPDLLLKLLSEMMNFQWKENKFEIAKESLVRRVEDFQTYQPYKMAASYVWHLLYNCSTNNHPVDEAPTGAENLQVDDMERFTKQLFSRVFLQGLIYGNADEKLARNTINMIESFFSRSSVVLPQEILPPRVTSMDDNSNYLYQAGHIHSKSSGYYGQFQIGSDSVLSDVVLTDLLAKYVHEKCIQKLIVEEALGISVDCGQQHEDGILSFRIMIQSDKHPCYVKSRVELFLQYIHEMLINVTEEEFELSKTALRDTYTEKIINQEQRFNSYWREISFRRYNFRRGNLKVKLLESLLRGDLLSFFEKHMLKDAGERKKLDIYVVSEVTDPALEDDVPLDECTEIEDAVSFRSSFGTFAHMLPQMSIDPVGISVPL